MVCIVLDLMIFLKATSQRTSPQGKPGEQVVWLLSFSSLVVLGLYIYDLRWRNYIYDFMEVGASFLFCFQVGLPQGGSARHVSDFCQATPWELRVGARMFRNCKNGLGA